MRNMLNTRDVMKFNRSLRVYLLIGITASLIGLVTTVYAQGTGTVGGSGGAPYELTCGPEEAIVGLEGRSGKYVDSIYLKCVRINDQGKWVGIVGAGGGDN